MRMFFALNEVGHFYGFNGFECMVVGGIKMVIWVDGKAINVLPREWLK